MQFRSDYKLGEHTAGEILDDVLAQTKYLSKYDEEIEEDLARIENVKELAAVAAEFSDITSFLEKVSLACRVLCRGKGEKDKNSITLMTLPRPRD
jgi:superfamily I DNA/RNA helicase